MTFNEKALESLKLQVALADDVRLMCEVVEKLLDAPFLLVEDRGRDIRGEIRARVKSLRSLLDG